ncbi:ATP-dependent DNA ligase [Candidatus Woesearchaeota archaeon]|nr:ATP-dependent DNA ligase [Candidatus Woesearchaeota archaeon]
MIYQDLVEVYERLGKTTKRLEKTYIISEFLKKSPKEVIKEVIYLLEGRVFPPWDERKIGMSSMLIIKVIQNVTGTSEGEIKRLWKKTGDLGEVAKDLVKTNKQTKLGSQKLTIRKVVDNISKLPDLEGEGTVNRKVGLISELLSNASPLEAKYVVKTILEELRIGIAEGTMRDAIVWAFYPKVIGVFFKCEKCKAIMPDTEKCLECGREMSNKFKDETGKSFANTLEISSLDSLKSLDKYDFVIAKDERLAREAYNKFIESVQNAYNLSNDLGIVAENLKIHGIKSLEEIEIQVGTPINPMLAIKLESISEALEALGKPVLADYKLDGFRCSIHKKDDKITLFTRRLENVTKQFPEVVELVKSHVAGKTFILDSELVGFDPKTGKYKPFQDISQRIRRKYDISKMAKELPVEINIFDVLYYEGENMMSKPQDERRKLIEKIVKPVHRKIVLTRAVISGDEKELEKFYDQALKDGVEGLILKSMSKEYTSGRKVGGWVKIKPTLEPLDLVIIGGTYGEGKRAHVLSSFILACRSGSRFMPCGMVGTGIKEKEDEEGVTFAQLTSMLKPYIISEKGRHVDIKPEIVVEVAYEEIQKSPTYESGYALRFPRVLRLRSDDKKASQANTLSDVEHIYHEQKKFKSKIK